jgi:hypothetical protein
MNKFIIFTMSVLFSSSAYADVAATAFYYQEKETGVDVSHVRYLVTDNYLRIDDGNDADGFILFDQTKNTIYNINHNDQTAMEIKHHQWHLPDFKFERKIETSKMTEAPKVSGKIIERHQVFADDQLCTDVKYIPDLYVEEMKVFLQYQKILSGQQVKVLNNTPKDMQSPCFLVDQIYNDGAHYRKGLPVQIWHSRGYAKMLVDFKQIQVEEALFVLPENYRVYNPYVQ